MATDASAAHADPPRRRAVRTVLAYGVHAFTASGAVLGLLSLLEISARRYEAALLYLMAALFVDAVDGMMARAIRVSEVLPHIDGRRLDDMVDFLNFVLVPAVFFVSAGHVVHWGVVAFMILASAYGFANTQAKTDDDFFLGFPSYWNIIAAYCWLLEIGPLGGTLWVVGLGIAVFVPFKFVYPSRMHVLWGTNAVLSTLAFALLVASLLEPELGRTLCLPEISLGYIVFYFAVSFWQGGLLHRAPET